MDPAYRFLAEGVLKWLTAREKGPVEKQRERMKKLGVGGKEMKAQLKKRIATGRVGAKGTRRLLARRRADAAEGQRDWERGSLS